MKIRGFVTIQQLKGFRMKGSELTVFKDLRVSLHQTNRSIRKGILILNFAITREKSTAVFKMRNSFIRSQA